MKRILAFVFVLGIITLFSSQAQAVVIYDSFGPGNNYLTHIGYTMIGDSQRDVDQGETFTSSGDYVLGSIELPVGVLGGYYSGLDVWLMNDNSGQPGSIIESFHYSGSMGNFGAGIFNPPILINSVSHPVLTEGTQYWLVGSATNVGSLVWNFNSVGVVAPHALRVDMAAWNISTKEQGAFRISGSLYEPGGVIPEPASLSLLGLGLLGLMGFRKKKL